MIGLSPTVRCFGDGDPLYEVYHDEEWGREVRGDTSLFERMTLEGFQSGLSWITILRKRENFRSAFHNFDPELISRYNSGDVNQLLQDSGIIRNRMKIEATITNARALLTLQDRGSSLDELIWSHVPAQQAAPKHNFADLPASTPESAALAKALKKVGFTFVGPTTMYALMQACGLVDDHLVTCPRSASSATN